MTGDTAFLAGAAGAVGRRLAPLLIAAGWRVVGTTRSPARVPLLRAMGVEPVVLDAYDAAALRRAVVAAQPRAVIHQLTDLPPALDPARMAEALPRNARLRDEGTRNLVAAAIAAGAGRLVAASLAFVYAPGRAPHGEDDPLALDDPAYGATVRGVASLERQVTEAPLAGVVLRYGLLYGAGTGFDAPGNPPALHVDAAARAAVLAAAGDATGIFNIAEDDGAVTIDKARRMLGFDPAWRGAAP